ncbi:sodium/hydrogen exchanger 6 [Tanacetum coccineum]
MHDMVSKLRIELDVIQKALDQDPSSEILCEDQATYLSAFTQAALDEERFLKQKAKVEWLRVGDNNFVYFHRMVKSKISITRIDTIMSSDNMFHEGINVPIAFVNHYTHFLGMEEARNQINKEELFLRRLDQEKAVNMILREINHSIIALLPKEGLDDIVSDNQFAFILGRSISDNVLITQELMHNYHLNRGLSRCAFKIDIQKAYDTVN